MYPKKQAYVHKKTCTRMFRAHLKKKKNPKNWKKPKCPLVGEWINKLRVYLNIRNTKEEEKRISYWHLLQRGWISQMMCREKRPDPKEHIRSFQRHLLKSQSFLHWILCIFVQNQLTIFVSPFLNSLFCSADLSDVSVITTVLITVALQ